MDAALIPTIAVIPSNGRPFLEECISSIKNQVDRIVVVSNGNNSMSLTEVNYVPDTEEDLNISRWWNLGIDVASSLVIEDEWNILVLNDDVIACPHLVETLSREMRSSTSVLAFPNQHDDQSILHREPKSVDLRYRITGYCFMLRGEAEMRIDERFVWWYGDDDLDWRCRTNGGSLLVPGCRVDHQAPNGTFVTNPELHVTASLDRQNFIGKWGKAPW